MPPESSRDLESNILQLKDFDDRRAAVCKELKRLVDCLNDLSAQEKVLLEELNCATLHDAERFAQAIDKWSTFLNDVGKNREDLWTIVGRTAVEPLKRQAIAFAEMRSAIKRMETLTAEKSRHQAKVAKYQGADRTSTNLIKLNDHQSRLAQTTSDLNTLREVLERELPLFLQRRIDYMQPSLAAYISSEILYSGSNLNACAELNALSDQLTESERAERQRQLLDSIDGLSIVAS